MRVEEFLEQSAARSPEKIGLVCGDRRYSYAEIDHRANQLANALMAAGIRRHDRVLIFLENSFEAVVAIFATIKAGCIFVVISPGTKRDKLAYLLNDSDARALVTSQAKLANTHGAIALASALALIVVTDAVEADETGAPTICSLAQVFTSMSKERPARTGIDIDLAMLVYTSGSTGIPKGVMMTHHSVVAAATSITSYLENTADDVILNVLPLAFDYGLYQLLMAFKMGATLVLERGCTFLYPVVEKMVREGVTGLPLVPTISSLLLQLPLENYDFSKLRYITNTAAALPEEHIRQLRRRLPQVKIYSMYGLTECKRVSYLPPEQIDIRPRSVGRGMPNEEVYIVDEAGRRLPPGEVGELVVRGANVMKGYWKLPVETAQVLKDGRFPWPEKVLHTGDLFTSDQEGYLYWVGRTDDIIKTRGEKVSPKEVEEVLYAMPAIADAVVVGVPDEVLGHAINAFVTLKEGLMATEQEILRYCKEHLEEFMVPRSVAICREIPKSENGKLKKRALAQAGVEAA